MAQPTDEERYLNSLLEKIDLGGNVPRFIYTGNRNTEEELFASSNCVEFYNKRGTKIGELYFLENPMRVVELEPSFKQYADDLKKKLGI